ncbi:MAG: hypothetical protein DWQ10_13910, partial [Calditrichaeota bacterium]
PTILQVKTCFDALNRLRCFIQIQIIETLEREWKDDNVSVRPSQRMVGHTAFLVFARRVEYGVKPLQPAKTARVEAERAASTGKYGKHTSTLSHLKM